MKPEITPSSQPISDNLLSIPNLHKYVNGDNPTLWLNEAKDYINYSHGKLFTSYLMLEITSALRNSNLFFAASTAFNHDNFTWDHLWQTLEYEIQLIEDKVKLDALSIQSSKDISRDNDNQLIEPSILPTPEHLLHISNGIDLPMFANIGDIWFEADQEFVQLQKSKTPQPLLICHIISKLEDGSDLKAKAIKMANSPQFSWESFFVGLKESCALERKKLFQKFRNAKCNNITELPTFLSEFKIRALLLDIDDSIAAVLLIRKIEDRNLRRDIDNYCMLHPSYTYQQLLSYLTLRSLRLDMGDDNQKQYRRKHSSSNRNNN